MGTDVRSKIARQTSVCRYTNLFLKLRTDVRPDGSGKTSFYRYTNLFL
jgi:hypothetical protein